MDCTIRLVAGDADREAARALLLANGWHGRRFEAGPFAGMLAGSHEALVAVDGERVVGFARSVSDGVSNGYLCTLVVDAAYRDRGIARALVERADEADRPGREPPPAPPRPPGRGGRRPGPPGA